MAGAVGTRETQSRVYALANFPTEYVRLSQANVTYLANPSTPVQVSQGIVLALCRGYVGDPRIRAWGYSQDGHDFYVLHLGTQGTVVYDATTDQWSLWNTEGREGWRAGLGLDWIGMAKDNYDGGAATQIVAGDDNWGVLWTLDPTAGIDDDPSSDETHIFQRAVRGGVPITERNNMRCNGVWLRISTGLPIDGVSSDILLRSSDDQGASWTDHGTVTVEPGAFTQTIFWRSLGLIRPPIRIFEFVDTGAMVRIDGADIDAE